MNAFLIQFYEIVFTLFEISSRYYHSYFISLSITHTYSLSSYDKIDYYYFSAFKISKCSEEREKSSKLRHNFRVHKFCIEISLTTENKTEIATKWWWVKSFSSFSNAEKQNKNKKHLNYSSHSFRCVKLFFFLMLFSISLLCFFGAVWYI